MRSTSGGRRRTHLQRWRNFTARHWRRIRRFMPALGRQGGRCSSGASIPYNPRKVRKPQRQTTSVGTRADVGWTASRTADVPARSITAPPAALQAPVCCGSGCHRICASDYAATDLWDAPTRLKCPLFPSGRYCLTRPGLRSGRVAPACPLAADGRASRCRRRARRRRRRRCPVARCAPCRPKGARSRRA